MRKKGLQVIGYYRIVTKYNNQESADLWKTTMVMIYIDIMVL